VSSVLNAENIDDESCLLLNQYTTGYTQEIERSSEGDEERPVTDRL